MKTRLVLLAWLAFLGLATPTRMAGAPQCWMAYCECVHVLIIVETSDKSWAEKEAANHNESAHNGEKCAKVSSTSCP